MKRISARAIFILTVFLGYLVLLIFNFQLAKNAFWASIGIFKEIFFIFLIVFVFLFLSNLFFEAKKIVKLLKGGRGFWGWLIAVISGIVSTGPIFVWYPFLKNLKEQGISDSFIVIFLYNRAVKIPFLPVMIYYFGVSFTILLTLYMIIFSLLNACFFRDSGN